MRRFRFLLGAFLSSTVFSLHAQVFVLNGTMGTVAEMTTTGTVVNASLISGLTNPTAIAVSPKAIFVADAGGTRLVEYSLTGTPIGLLSGTASTPIRSLAVTSDGSIVFSLAGSTVSGAPPDGSLTVVGPVITGLVNARAIAIGNNTLYVLNSTGTVSSFGLAADQPSNSSLITGLSGASSIAASGSAIYIGTFFTSQAILGGLGEVAEYDPTGKLLKSELLGDQAEAPPVVAAAPSAVFAAMTNLAPNTTNVMGSSDLGLPLFFGKVLPGPVVTGIAAIGVSIPTAPLSATVAFAQTTSFRVVANGLGPLSYQWQQNGAAIAGATDPYLLLHGALAADAGTYTCRVTDANGLTTLSPPAALTVMPMPDPAKNDEWTYVGRLENVSVLAYSSPAPAKTAVGFTVGGAPGSMNVLIRAVGPELSQFGVTNAAAMASLQYFSTAGGTATLLNANHGWSSDAAQVSSIESTEAALGAFPLTLGSASSAILASPISTTGPTPYTTEISTDGGAGSILAEIYDSTGAARTADQPFLTNVSARAQVGGAAGGPLVAGFVIGGTTPKTVLIRAVGPSLAPFGVTQPLAATALSVYSTNNPSGSIQLVATNAAWSGDPILSAVMADVAAFPLPAASADSALLLTLPPGNYTANVSSPTGGAGTALVEVYAVSYSISFTTH